MIENNKDIIDLDDMARLNRTQNIRSQIIDELMAKGVPQDPDDRVLLIKVLDGSDKHVFSKAKIKNDQAANNTQRDVTRMMADVLTRIDAGAVGNARRQSLPVLDSTIVAENVVDGETDIGVKTFNYDQFMSDK